MHNLDFRVFEDLSGPAISTLADQAIEKYPSNGIKTVNAILNAWHTSWTLGQHCASDHEQHYFSRDPLPFWWLAKFYLILWCCSHLIDEQSEFSRPRHKGACVTQRVQSQVKVVGWLHRFRGGQATADPQSMNYLSYLMEPMGD